MAQAAEPVSDVTGKGGAKPLLFGLLAGLLLGGGAFAAVYLGYFDPSALLGGKEAEAGAAAAPSHSDIGFVPMEPIVISLPRGAPAKHLRFTGQLEVVPAHAEEVTSLMPRILDVLNTYLRAVEPADLEQPAATVWLRAQMLRRVQVVTGEGRVRDLLITEFVLN